MFKVYKALKQQVLQKIEYLWKRITQRHKSVHLALEVKTSFGNSTPTMALVHNPVHKNLDFPLLAVNSIARREERRNLHTTVIKQSLSDYAQQDWPNMTKWSTSRHAKDSSGNDS
jgi:hypothetical protein